MTGERDTETLQGAMDDQACAWIARLSADTVSEQDRRDFALWLAASPSHRASLDAMLELWEDLEIVRYRSPEAPAGISRRRWLGTGIALAASVLVAVMLSPGLGLGPDSQSYRTRLGEQLSVRLSDGSQVRLNTNTALDVHFDTRER